MFVSLLPCFQLLLFLLQLFFPLFVVLLPRFELFLLPPDLLLPPVEFLQISDLHLHVCLIDDYDFLIKVLNLLLELLDLAIHPLNVLLSLPEVVFPFVLLLLEMLLQEAEIAGTLLIYFFATTLPAY